MHVKQKILILHHMFWIIWVMGRYIHFHCHLCFSCVSSFPAYIHSNQIMGWGEKAIEIRSVETGHLDGVFMHKRAQRLKFLCERNDKVKKKKKNWIACPLILWFGLLTAALKHLQNMLKNIQPALVLIFRSVVLIASLLL